MAVQIFLQGKLLGIQEFLLSPASAHSNEDHDRVFTGRSQWAALLSEILPRALLAALPERLRQPAFERTGAQLRRALQSSASFYAKRLILVEQLEKNGLNKEIRRRH